MKALLVANLDWYLYNYRLALAIALRARGYEVTLMCPSGRYVHRFAEHGLEWRPLEFSRQKTGIFAVLAEFLQFRRAIADIRPDVVHLFTTKPVIYGSICASLISHRYAVVNALTGLGPVFSSRRRGIKLLRSGVVALLRLALNGKRTQNIFQNPDDLVQLEQFGVVNRRNCHIIYGSGVSTRRFVPTVAEPPCGRSMKVLMATRLIAFKGVREYVQAARLLNQRGLDAEFILAGDPDPGNMSCIPEEEIEEWKREGIVRCIGHIDDIRPLLGEVDVVALPSYREGVPRILIEAAAMEKPIVTTDAPGCREIVINGHNGYTVPVQDVEALAAQLAVLLKNSELRAAMGARGRRLVLERFDENIVIDQTIRVYELALGRSTDVPPATRAASQGAH